MSDIFQPSTKKREVPFRGIIPSKNYNGFMDTVVKDFSAVSSALNDLSARFNRLSLQRETESRTVFSVIQGAKATKEAEDLRALASGADITYDCQMTLLDNLSFTIDEARRLRVDPLNRVCMLPFNGCVSRLYSVDPRIMEVYVPADVAVTVTAVDETGGTVWPDNPQLAVDGRLGIGFLRQVAFPVSSDKTSVTMDVDIDVSSLYSAYANLLTVMPSPAGQVDILSIKYSTTTATPTTDLPGFSATYNVSSAQYHFEPLAITKLRVRMRQQNWVIENAMKNFMYGIQELHLDIVDFDRTNNGGSGFDATDNVAIFRVDAPTGSTFNQIKAFGSSPTYATALSDNGIYFALFENDALSTGLATGWESYSDPTIAYNNPASWIDASGSPLSSIYVAVKLAYDSTNEVSPVLKSFYITYTVQ